MPNYYPPLEEDRYYHVFNRGNNGDNIFYEARNYAYFLRKYQEHLGPWLDTYAYCLLPNHFHLLVRVKARDSRDSIASSDGIPVVPPPRIPHAVSERFRRFFLGYSQAINKQEGRTGSLFQKNFKRLLIDSEAYFMNVLFYIHKNPQMHRITLDFREYPYSSYLPVLFDEETWVKAGDVIDLFGSKEAFMDQHNLISPLQNQEDWLVEEDD